MITLRKLLASDLSGLVRLANDENVSRYMTYTFPYPYTTADAQWWINQGSKQNGANTRMIGYDGQLSGHVLEKCGYTLERVLKSEVKKGGQYFDKYHFARLSLDN